eukprot:CAMPEP_0183726328 /NCGR_PEP_ID=MMETSP0737-20130205/23054_1 /TAXON_ID=385413 /ORGANISM="Thalassiosira miniscula, Strain CCMP1093" /LENGTH=321 /DNA_ID=CAMNT_0025957645 /DNA_START=123 /DNA_END=1088 /DNA_ORIENTATION=-
MATPAILLFVVTCAAQLISGIRGSDSGSGTENNVGNNGNNSSGGHSLVRGSSIVVAAAAASPSGDNPAAAVSLERHHGHGHGHGSYNHNNNNNNNNSPSHASNDNSFDYYAYSMSYQPEFCRENNERFVGCSSFQEEWEGQLTIHGLWPNRNDGTWPSTCTDEKLDVSLMDEISMELNERWPNVKSSTDSKDHTAFWAHEWTKHGTCSGLSQHDYFQTALNLFIPTPSIVLQNYGSVVPKKHLQQQFNEEEANDGADNDNMTILVCKYGYLSEVRACYEKMEDGKAGKRMVCPNVAMKEDTCGEEIKIASFASSKVVTAVE